MTVKVTYRTLRSSDAWTAPTTPGAELPKVLTVLKWGDNHTSQGLVRVTETTLSAMPDYHKAMNWDEMAIDYEHASLPTSATYRGEPVPLAGYCKLKELSSGQPLQLDVTRWLPSGIENAHNYRDVSAVVALNEQLEVVGIQSVALCRMGAAPDMVFLSAPWEAEKAPRTAEEAIKILREVTNLPETATPADILESFSDQILAMSTPTKPTKTAAEIAAETANAELARTAAVAKATETTTVETPAKVDEPTDVKALSAAVAVLTAEVKALSASTTARERSEIIAQAAREGKQLPGEDTLKLLDNVQLRALSAGLPVTVPMEHRVPHADLVALSSPSAPVNDVISKHTGVTDEMRKKYGAA